MFYVTRTTYVGPNPGDERNSDFDYISIRTAPALTNSSQEPCFNGWCGTTDDLSVHAYGEYETLMAARAFIRQRWGDTRDTDRNGEPFEREDEHTVEVYRLGRYTPMSESHTADWLAEAIARDIAADTSDARIDELLARYQADANAEGYALHKFADQLLREARDEMKQARE